MNDSKKFLTIANNVPKIEILKGNRLEEKVNLTGRKIAIKHYLNTYLHTVDSDSDKNERFPLYVRIIFNRQSIKVKSAINAAFSKTEFFNLDSDTVDLLVREALTLTDFVSSHYNDTMQYLGTSSGSSMGVDYQFNINELFENYDYDKLTLPYLHNKSSNKEILRYASAFSPDTDYNFILASASNINSFQLFQYLLFGNSRWEKFSKSPDSQIWFFDLHYLQFISENSKYSILGASKVDFKHLEFEQEFAHFLLQNGLNYKTYELFID